MIVKEFKIKRKVATACGSKMVHDTTEIVLVIGLYTNNTGDKNYSRRKTDDFTIIQLQLYTKKCHSCNK